MERNIQKKATLPEYSNKIASLRKGSFSHFPYILPGKTGFLANRYEVRETVRTGAYFYT